MSPKNICIAVDAMGGDFAPYEIVKGAVMGARVYHADIILVGDETKIKHELSQYDTRGLNIEIVHTNETIDMDESPATALRKKKNASIVLTAKQVGAKKAQGMVAAGSTGAAMASALFNIGRLEGIDRPAIGVVLPAIGDPCMLIDAGANADCIPEMLLQFARMGSVFMQAVYNIEQPKVGLLNIGGEAGKGNAFVNSAFKLLENESNIHFIGNIEGRDMFAGTANVAVCDGFTGNIALKSAEGVASLLKKVIKKELTSSLAAKAGALLVKPAFERAIKRVDHEELGGALLLGIKGICVIAHGGSSSNAIKNAIRVAVGAVENQVLTKIIQSKPLEPCAASTVANGLEESSVAMSPSPLEKLEIETHDTRERTASPVAQSQASVSSIASPDSAINPYETPSS